MHLKQLERFIIGLFVRPTILKENFNTIKSLVYIKKR